MKDKKESHPVRPKERFLVFGAPSIEDNEIEEVVDSLKKGWLGTGPKVAQFEKNFAAYKGAEFAVAVNSCTAALALCAAYPQIFKKSLFSAPRLGAVNFHPSFLPRCRGAHPIYWTIASQEDCGGVSCHVMTDHLDAGDLVAQRRIPIDKTSITYRELYDCVLAETPKLFKDVEDYYSAARHSVPQTGKPSYYRNEREIHKRVFFGREDTERISAKIRAGGAFAFDRFGRKLQFSPPLEISHSCENVTNDLDELVPDGTVVQLGVGYVIIRVGNKYLRTTFRIPGTGLLLRIVKKVLRIFGDPQRDSVLMIGEILR